MPEGAQIEAAARALFERDQRRSAGLPSGDYVWPRVADEYRRAAKVALEAATSDFAVAEADDTAAMLEQIGLGQPTDCATPEPQRDQGRLL